MIREIGAPAIGVTNKIAKPIAFLVAAIAACYLGLVVSRLIWFLPVLFAGLFSEDSIYSVFPSGAVPRLRATAPTDGPWLAFAAFASGPIVITTLSLAAGPAVVSRLKGWFRLVFTFTLFWLAILLGESALRLVQGGRGPLGSAAQAIGISRIGPFSTDIPLAILVGSVAIFSLCRAVACLGSGPDATMRPRLFQLALWFALPVVILNALPDELGLSGSRFFRQGFLYGPSLLAIVVTGLAALRPFRSSPVRNPGLVGAGVTILFAGIAFSAITNYEGNYRGLPADSEPFTADVQITTRWAIHFEKGMLSATERAEWGEAADLRLEQFAQRLDIDLVRPPLRANVYFSAEAKRSMTGGRRRADPPIKLDVEERLIHELIDPSGKIADPRGEALLLMADYWGEAGSPTIANALARYAIGTFQGDDLQNYARRVTCEERVFPLADVLRINGDFLSPLARDVLGGAWIDSLVTQQGARILPLLYRGGVQTGAEPSIAAAAGRSWDEMQSQWQAFLTDSPECDEVPALTQSARKSRWHRGISLSHEVGGNWGYGSSLARVQLERIRELGADSIAIVPYVFTRAPQETSIRFRTDETDSRVVRTIQEAKQAGLSVTLKPHLWAGRFTGEIAFEDEFRFNEWFAQYRAWILHSARLAELHDVDLLSIGNELGGVTTHEAAWRELIRSVRRVYQGEVTYASNWDRELEAVKFWDDLDYIGVNFYFPLGQDEEIPAPDSPRLRELTDRLRTLSQRFDKPLIFTEVGFPSTSTAAIEPWRETNAPLDLELQRRCYETVFRAFAGEPWFFGMYWWKWPTHGRGGPFDTSYNPIGKPALEVVREWYQRRASQPEPETTSLGIPSRVPARL